MKSLYIVRHAKSSWDEPFEKDEERPLMDKGLKRTEKVIEYLCTHKIDVQLIISSHAVRAWETARLFAKGLNYPEERIVKRPSLYHADEEAILDEVRSISDEVNSVMLVGHNPGFTQFVSFLLEREIEWLGTSALVRIDFNTDRWSQTGSVPCALNFMISPKMLK
jgi:phosphohistidine phosphatase